MKKAKAAKAPRKKKAVAPAKHKDGFHLGARLKHARLLHQMRLKDVAGVGAAVAIGEYRATATTLVQLYLAFILMSLGWVGMALSGIGQTSGQD